MRTRCLTRKQIQAEPSCVWNAYVDLLAMEDCDDLTPEQRPPHLVFWYEQEVQNGGHFQYFENCGTEHLEETVVALGLLGAPCQQQVLTEAGDLWSCGKRPPIQTVDDYCRTALKSELDSLDTRSHACSQTLAECLDTYPQRHQSRFVTIV